MSPAVPTNDNPTTETISAENRKQIADVARRENLQIIEDDAYGLLAGNPPPPIASLVPDLCWYIASTSKVISPALRVAFDRLVQDTRAEAAWRQAAAREILGSGTFASQPEGYHLWLRMPDGSLAAHLPVLMRNTGLGLAPSDGFAVGGHSDQQAMRVSLGGPIGRSALSAAQTVGQYQAGRGESLPRSISRDRRPDLENPLFVPRLKSPKR